MSSVRCNAPCVADCTGKKKQASSKTDVAVFILGLNCYTAAISTSIVFWISKPCVRELLTCMQFSCDSRSRVDPFIPGVLSCSHTTDTSKCFILSLFCSVFFCLFCKLF